MLVLPALGSPCLTGTPYPVVNLGPLGEGGRAPGEAGRGRGGVVVIAVLTGGRPGRLQA